MMQDDQIIELYLNRDQQAIKETESKYGCFCMDLAFRILNDREDAREAVNDTWLRAWSTIPPKRPEVLRLYLAKITRNLSLSIPYWFLYSYIGYLLVLPFIRRMVRGMKDTEWNYLFGVYLLFQGIVPVAEYLFFNGRVNMNPSLDIRMVTTDVLVFPALGWYLENRRLSRRELLALWLGAATAVAVTVFMTHYKILLTGQRSESQVGTFYKTMRLLPAAAVYSTVKMLPELPHWVKSAITVLGGCTFGVYLIEQILRERLYPLCDRLFNIIPPPAGTMIYAALVFFFCIPFVCAIKKTPFFKQLI